MSITSYVKEGKTLFLVKAWQRDPKGRKVQKQKSGIKTRAQAQKLEMQMVREIDREIANLNTSPTWGSIVEEWEIFARRDLKDRLQWTTVIDRVNAMRTYTEIWWTLPANEINRADVREAFDLMELEDKTVSLMKFVKSTVNAIFQWGIDYGHIRGVVKSPADGYGLKKAVEKVPLILSLEEIRKLLSLAESQKHPWYPVWSMALMTGMRSGELYAIKWSDVDWENNQLMVSKSYNGRLKIVKSTKAGYWREVPINSELMLLLKRLKAEANGRAHILPRLPRWAGEAAKHIRAFCKGNGISEIKFHDLRSCFATQLIRQGIAPAIVMKICGWRDMKTMQRYIRYAGIETIGATDGLKIMPEDEVMGEVVNLFIDQEIK